jgi:putative transposase
MCTLGEAKRGKSLRFQIEFNFRDAKQYWGLEVFMNVSPTAVTNASNLAFLIVKLSTVLFLAHRQQQPDFSVFDLKMHFRHGVTCAKLLNHFSIRPLLILFLGLGQRLSVLGGIRLYADYQDVAPLARY